VRSRPCAEGYELIVSQPQVIFKGSGEKLEPYEDVVID
jgi:predicted membrane GTPase involved in stress response